MTFRRPLHEILTWDAAEIRLMQSYLAKQPPADERIDLALAGLRQVISSYLRAEGKTPPRLIDFLPFHDPWNATPVASDARYSDLDREILQALGN